MKIKDGFLLREIAGRFMAVPIGERTAEMHGMVALNETGAFMWKKLADGCTENELLEAVLAEYEVSEEDAAENVKEFLAYLHDEKLLTEAEG